MTRQKIVVLGGGYSSERNVSLSGAANIAITLRKLDFDVITIDPCTGPMSLETEIQFQQGAISNAPSLEEMSELHRKMNIVSLLQSCAGAELIFPLIHGEFGEDGQLQAVLEAAKLPYVGSDYVGLALSMDKHLSKQLFVTNDIPTARWVCLTTSERYEERFGYPVVVKPVKGGSTVGMSICRNDSELNHAIAQAFDYDQRIIIEEFVAGREFTVGVLDGEVLAIGEIRSSATMFDYQAKYQAAETQEIFPAELSSAVVDNVRKIIRKVYEVLQLRHYCRIDFMLNQHEEPFILEANSIPGMTRKSLFPQSAQAVGLNFDTVCERLVTMALRDYRPPA